VRNGTKPNPEKANIFAFILVILLRTPEGRRLAFWVVVPRVVFLPTHARIPTENDHGHPPFFCGRQCIELEARLRDWCIIHPRRNFSLFSG
jgi:hypothetical protein